MNISGLLTHIRNTQQQDIPFLQSMWNEGSVMRYKGYPDGMHVTQDSMQRWWETIQQSDEKNASPASLSTSYCIIELHDHRPIGEISYAFDAHRRVSLDIMLAPKYYGHGYATDAVSNQLRELFSSTDVSTVLVEPTAANTAAVKLFQRCGFYPTPTENHPNRLECSRMSFAKRDNNEREGLE